MSYTAIRDGLLEQLRSVEGFSSRNVLYGDWEHLNAGIERGAVVKFAGMQNKRDAFSGEYSADWMFDIKVLTAFDADVPTSWLAQDQNRDAILARLRQYPLLDSAAGVIEAVVESVAPEPESIQIGAVNFWIETISYRVNEDVQADEQE